MCCGVVDDMADGMGCGLVFVWVWWIGQELGLLADGLWMVGGLLLLLLWWSLYAVRCTLYVGAV